MIIMLRTAIATAALGFFLLNPVSGVFDGPTQAHAEETSTGQLGSALPVAPESDVPAELESKPLPTTGEAPRTPVEVPAEITVPEVTRPEPLDYVAPVDCPEEDTCWLDYTSDAQWILYYQGERPFSVVLPVTCPQEDDCHMSYQGEINRWVITENYPH